MHVKRRLEIINTVEIIGMAEIAAKEVDFVLNVQNLNVMQIITLQSTDRYCAFLSPRKLADAIVKSMNYADYAMTERVFRIITESFSDTNFAVMKMQVTDSGKFDVAMRKGSPVGNHLGKLN